MTIIPAWRSLLQNEYITATCGDIIRLAQIALVMPVTTVECERGFSKMKLIKDSTRNCLSVNLDSVLRLYIGEDTSNESSSFFKSAIKSWQSLKRRRTARGNYKPRDHSTEPNKKQRGTTNDDEINEMNDDSAESPNHINTYNHCTITIEGNARL